MRRIEKMKAHMGIVSKVMAAALALSAVVALLAAFPSTVTAAASPTPLTDTQLEQITGGMCEPEHCECVVDNCNDGPTVPATPPPKPPDSQCGWSLEANKCLGCDTVIYSYGTREWCTEVPAAGCSDECRQRWALCNPECVNTCTEYIYGSDPYCLDLPTPGKCATICEY